MERVDREEVPFASLLPALHPLASVSCVLLYDGRTGSALAVKEGGGGPVMNSH